LLLEHSADPLAVDANGNDAVYKAAGSGNLELLQLLMRYRDDRDGATVAAVSNSPQLLAAASYGQVQCAEWLLARSDVHINATDRTGWTALHFAAANCCDCSHMLEQLLSHGADVHAHTDKGDDALAILVRNNGSVQCAELLLAAGADAAHLNNAGIGRRLLVKITQSCCSYYYSTVQQQ
jgi:ankyrin repeat protein